jgi:hypothetical protein
VLLSAAFIALGRAVTRLPREFSRRKQRARITVACVISFLVFACDVDFNMKRLCSSTWPCISYKNWVCVGVHACVCVCTHRQTETERHTQTEFIRNAWTNFRSDFVTVKRKVPINVSGNVWFFTLIERSHSTKNTLNFAIFNPLKTKRISFIQGLSAYRAVNTLHFGYKNQSLNVL